MRNMSKHRLIGAVIALIFGAGLTLASAGSAQADAYQYYGYLVDHTATSCGGAGNLGDITMAFGVETNSTYAKIMASPQHGHPDGIRVHNGSPYPLAFVGAGSSIENASMNLIRLNDQSGIPSGFTHGTYKAYSTPVTPSGKLILIGAGETLAIYTGTSWWWGDPPTAAVYKGQQPILEMVTQLHCPDGSQTTIVNETQYG